MSFTPPPFQPPGAQPQGPVPPPWQADPSSSLRAEPGPKKTSKLPLILGAVVVVAALVVVAVLVLGGDDGKAAKTVDGEAAHVGLQALIDDTDFGTFGTAELRDCPLGDLDDLFAAVGDTIDPAVVDGDDSIGADVEGDQPASVECGRSAGDDNDVDKGPTSVTFKALLDPQRDYEGYLTDFDSDLFEITLEDTVPYEGGEIFPYCFEATDYDIAGCAADWVDKAHRIVLAVTVSGIDSDQDDTVSALKAVLPTMADSLAALADSES